LAESFGAIVMTSRPSHASRVRGPASIVGPVEIAQPAGAAAVQAGRLELPSGRSIECHDAPAGGELVTIRNPAGRVELEVRLTEAGPVLLFDAAQLELRATGRIRADCESLEIVTAGDAALRVGGELSTSARTTDIASTRGDVRIRANDDVRLNGERVKLNC
jgi:hypothetical protein